MKFSQVLFSLIGWLGLIVFTALCVFFVLIERPYLSYGNLPFPPLTPTVKVGEAIHLRVMRCNADSKTRVYILGRTLVPLGPGAPYVLPASAATVEPGCHYSISAVNVIPVGVPPGRYYIQGLAEVNGTLRTFNVGWTSQPFEVTQ